MVLSFFRKLSRNLKKEEKHCNSENIEDFRNVQRQIYFKIVQVSSKPFGSKKWVMEFYTQLFKDLKPTPGEWKKRPAFERLLLPEYTSNDILQYLIR